MADYSILPGFGDLYLEDSWVLSIEPKGSTLTLVVDMVLRESHPLYAAPRAGERYCYRRGLIRFEHLVSISWNKQSAAVPATDATGEQDLGSFDKFQAVGDRYSFSGDFGEITVISHPPTVEFLD